MSVQDLNSIELNNFRQTDLILNSYKIQNIKLTWINGETPGTWSRPY